MELSINMLEYDHYQISIVPFGVRRDVNFTSDECYGINKGKCSLDEIPCLDQHRSGENDISYCQQFAHKIKAYFELTSKYKDKLLNNAALTQEELKEIQGNVNAYGYNAGKQNERIIDNLVSLSLYALSIIEAWEEDNIPRLILNECGHISFGDGRHRCCIADRLGIPIYVRLKKSRYVCGTCYTREHDKYKWRYWVLNMAEKVNNIKIPLSSLAKW